jgi:hypothetical protein
LKTALIVLGIIAVGIAVADLAAGNSNHPILPEFVGNHLDQQTDLLVGGAGAGLLFFATSQL